MSGAERRTTFKKIISSVRKALGFNPLADDILLLKSRAFEPLIRPITTIHSDAKGVAQTP
jgi:hypothetical protein